MAGRPMVVAEAATVEARDMAATVRDLETSGSRQAGNSRLLAMKKSPDCGQPVIISETAITERPEIRWTAWENMRRRPDGITTVHAHMGLGNNVAALEHANKAVALDPQNMEYQMLLQRLQSGGQWYESRQAAYGYPHVGGNDLCLKICLANLFCNLCCGGGGLCFGGYGGRGMF